MLNDKTILIVDDDPTLRDIYMHRFRIEGANMVYAPDGHAAMAEITSSLPHAVILDIMMPELNGLDLLHNIKEKVETAQIPVIILTALPDPDKKEQAKNLGAHSYFIKSEILPGELVEEIKRLFT